MFGKNRERRHTVFYRFVALNVAIMVVFYGITLVINDRVALKQESDLYRSSMNRVELFSNTLETDILRQKKAQFQFINSYELQKLCIAGHRLSDYEITEIVQRIQADVVLYMTVCEYSENITVLIPSIDRMISVKPMLDYLPAEDPIRSSPTENKTLYFHNDILYSEMNYPTSNVEGKSPLYTITMVVATARILSDMKHFFSEDASSTLLMDTEDLWHLSTDANAPVQLMKYFSQNAEPLRAQGSGLLHVELPAGMSWVVYRYSEPMNAFLINYRPLGIVTKMNAPAQMTIWLLSLFTFLMILFSIFWSRRTFDQPMTNLMNALGRVENGDLKMNIDYDRNDEFHYLYDQFNRMLMQLNRQIDMNYTNRIRTQQAELKQLQYHIKPHFLYNSIFLIYRMAIDGDVENIQAFSLTLGNYYRYITRVQSETIPLEREVDHIRSYISIQTTRFGDRIAVRLEDLPEDLACQCVPPLILQPVVENAFHHGVSMMESGAVIDIGIRSERGMVLITTEDNGRGMSDDDLKALVDRVTQDDVSETSTGLANVHHRLRIHFRGESGLRMDHSPLGGLRVVLVMDIEGRNHT